MYVKDLGVIDYLHDDSCKIPLLFSCILAFISIMGIATSLLFSNSKTFSHLSQYACLLSLVIMSLTLLFTLCRYFVSRCE